MTRTVSEARRPIGSVGAPEVHVGVVDEDLGHGDRVGAVVADGQLDRAGHELRALDGELLGRRAAALAEAGAAERGERAHGGDDQQQRDEPEHPGRDAARRGARPSRDVAGFHGYSETSKKPSQPSSVNSDWWAWNMYLPGFGKRISRIPRWPWQSMTVSVSSLGDFDVPVGM